jgi:hypothetical protein
MFTDTQLAAQLFDDGYRISDALKMQPNDLVEGILAMRRRNQFRVLVLDRMTAREADVRLTEARNDGWLPVRWLRIGPEKPITARLGLARGIA